VGINISMSGFIYFESELNIIEKMASKGVKIAVAAGNNNIDLDFTCKVYPACYIKRLSKKSAINFTVVGAKDVEVSNTGKLVTALEQGKDQGYPKMTGSSQATANFTGNFFAK
jgi:hypothetical protein